MRSLIASSSSGSPIVVSQNFSSATSLAMLAPISTLIVMPRFSWITSEMSFSPSAPSSTPCRTWNEQQSVSGSKIELHHSARAPRWKVKHSYLILKSRHKEQSQTLMRDIPSASLLTFPFIVSHTLAINWWGITNTKMSASLDASTRSGTASWEEVVAKQEPFY